MADNVHFLRKQEKMDIKLWEQTRLGWWVGEKAREQEGGGWAGVLGGRRARDFCVMDSVFPVKKEAGFPHFQE
jgi:hypothetical protein